ncbi:MAG TPA: hypothetical protein PLC54_08135 [Spirochaetales bacterium]|nr:hypothetical protein [Spirochaetales bacterium]
MNGVSVPKGDTERLAELKRKVHDDDYLQAAIQRIAQVLSGEIMQGVGARHGGRKQGQ